MTLPDAAVADDAPDPVRSPNLVRIICIAVSLAIAVLWLISIPPRYDQYRALDNSVVSDPAVVRANLASLGLSVRFFAGYNLALELLATIGFCAVAAVIFWRKSSQGPALLVAIFLVALGIGNTGTLHGLAGVDPALTLALRCLDNLGWLLFAYVCFLFPDGRFVPRWTRWMAILLTVDGLIDALFPGLLFGASSFLPFILLLFLSIGVTTIYAQIYRYRRVSGPIQRQQTKWVALGLTTAIGGFIGFSFLPLFVSSFRERGSLYDLLAPAAVTICLLAIPCSLLLAILRYRLYDIDLLINRALVYGSLTTTLALVYFGTIVLLQQTLHALTGQHSDLAVVGSTLAIAALAQPLRRRLQRLIDRRFYRRKYDAAHTVAAFAAQLHDETSLDQLRADLVAVVQETMQPTDVSVWLRTSVRSK
ncbi:MAG: hypothetical protein WBW04_22415 [Nitrolancea sp.]